MAKSKNKFSIKRLFKTLCIIAICYITYTVLITALYRFVNPPFTILMVQRCVEQTFSKDREVRLRKTWVKLEDISPYMLRGVVAAEDNNFKNHNGFDFKAIENARKINDQKGKTIYGASTITQQTAKNTFLWLHKSYFRKGLEAWHTVLMELWWPKKRIMEVYLNVIEFGDGIYGVEEASLYYFNKHASELTKREAALLSAILPSPLHRDAAHPSPKVQRRANMIQRKMNIIGPIRL